MNGHWGRVGRVTHTLRARQQACSISGFRRPSEPSRARLEPLHNRADETGDERPVVCRRGALSHDLTNEHPLEAGPEQKHRDADRLNPRVDEAGALLLGHVIRDQLERLPRPAPRPERTVAFKERRVAEQRHTKGNELVRESDALSAIPSRFFSTDLLAGRNWDTASRNRGAFSLTTARTMSSFRPKCLNSVPSAHPAARAICLVVRRASPPVSSRRCAASKILWRVLVALMTVPIVGSGRASRIVPAGGHPVFRPPALDADLSSAAEDGAHRNKGEPHGSDVRAYPGLPVLSAG